MTILLIISTKVWANASDWVGEPTENDVPSQTMSQIYRVEVPERDRFGSSEGLPRLSKFLTQVISALENPGELQQVNNP